MSGVRPRSSGWHARIAGAVLALVLVVSGCAAIPTTSQPNPVPQEGGGQATQEVPEPEQGLDPLSVVRQFVRASARPANDHAAARAYLSEAARERWQPDDSLTVIRNEFGTVYLGEEEAPDPENRRVVSLRASELGRLTSDNAFVSVSGDFEEPVRVGRQPNGEWRIIDAPGTVLITESDFSESYFEVPVYFFSPDSSVPVPDPRYVVARPRSGLSARVVDLVLGGPSNGLAGAVVNPLGESAELDSNVDTAPDGALVVPLTGITEESEKVRERMAVQVVRSLQHVTTSRIRLLSDGVALVPGTLDWRPGDLPAYESITSPSSELPGLMTTESGRIRSLDTGAPVQGPLGRGAYDVESAAQSINGQQLAVVEDLGDGGRRLRVGDYGSAGQVVDLSAERLTRPTWRPPSSNESKSSELWTVRDGKSIVRVQRDPDGAWAPQPVTVSELPDEGAITALRLSRDGTRAALVVNGTLWVASVVRTSSEVSLRSPRALKSDILTSAVDVDWSSQDTLVVATSSEWRPVVRVSVDGFEHDTFNSSNLGPPTEAVTAAPGRQIVVADTHGLWTAGEVGAVWVPHPHSRPGAEPFYPG
ncbi:LpqB family beta-propeller domain-containing protein [Saccharomonospora iraqiensis]|uniref:LpqB family beta-propeller domain-containing protein n=1 Tax=Saccharomonospora iraqiensis TaxID=52698 RepID=UPI00022E126E|nr:LpqB family beta-propeller domain-containing protein [Saccharomonospora iraqiensis]